MALHADPIRSPAPPVAADSAMAPATTVGPPVARLKNLGLMLNAGSAVSAVKGHAAQLRTRAIPATQPAAPGDGVVQRMTVAYTDADLGHAPAIAPTFANQIVQQIVHQRAAIPNGVKLSVVAFGDSAPPPVTYKHHVAYATTLTKLINLCEGKTRTDIVDEIGVRCDLVGIDTATFGLDPLSGVAAFNTWLDSAIVAICDWPNNIFRGLSGGGDPDTPIAPTVALANRLADARDTLNDIG